jgi:hypothetical protein
MILVGRSFKCAFPQVNIQDQDLFNSWVRALPGFFFTDPGESPGSPGFVDVDRDQHSEHAAGMVKIGSDA